MSRPVLSFVLAPLLLAGCTAEPKPGPPPESTAEAGEPDKPQADGGGEAAEGGEPTPKPSGLPEVASLEGAPAVPAVKVLDKTSECPPVAKLGRGAPESVRKLTPLLSALRAVSCAPELFGKPTAEILAAVSPADGVKLEIGRRYALVELEAPVAVADLMAAARIEGAKLRLEQGWSSSWLVVGSDEAPLTPWPPGQLRVRPPGERNDDRASGTISELTPETMVHDSFSIFMPETVLTFEADAFAAPAATNALIAMSTDPSLLAKTPEQAEPLLTSLGERFTLSHYSVGSKAEGRKGFSIRPFRTELGAAELAKALGLEGAKHERIGITDTNPDRLSHGGKTEIEWHGLELEIELDERESGFGLAKWTVDDILVLPVAKE